MNSANFLIIGANGQLGQALQKHYPNAQAVDVAELDITNAKAVDDFNWKNIEVIINAAAYTNVDGAETPEGRDLAAKVNAEAVANLSTIASKNDIAFIHVSTDYVFDGSKSPHLENEPFSPLNVYGRSKAEGDKIISKVPKYYILRTSWVIGDGKNFVRIMLELGKKGVNPDVVSDQIGRLTFTGELVRATDHLLSVSAPYGTYNISNDGDPVSWAEIARTTFKKAGLDNTVTDVTTAKYYAGKQGIALRPLQSTLDLSKIKATGFSPHDWRDDLREYIRKELAK